MESEKETKSEQRRSTLDYLEGQIEIWDNTARYKKSIIITWRRRITIYTLIGATLGILSQQVTQIIVDAEWLLGDKATTETMSVGSHEIFNLGFELHSILATFSAVFVALATFAGTKVLNNHLEKSQIKASTAAEALKAQAYLYAMQAPPYAHKDAEKILFKRVQLILKDVADVTPELSVVANKKKTGLGRFISIFYAGRKVLENEEQSPQRFEENVSFERYVEERINGQIHEFYRKNAAKFQRIVNNANAATLIFGFLGVVIGTVGATSSPGFAMWIGLLSTASASIASFIHAGKYEQLLNNYIATANKLELLSAKFLSMKDPDENMRHKFIIETETIFATQTNSWLSEFIGTEGDQISSQEK